MVDPFVLAYRRGSDQQYGKPVHATPNYDYSADDHDYDDNLIFLDQHSSMRELFNRALMGMKDLTLIAEVHHYHCAQAGYEAKEVELAKKMDELDKIAQIRRDLEYPVGTVTHKIHLYHNKRVTSPYHTFYILNSPTWTYARYITKVPAGIPIHEDIHAYFGLDECILPHPAFYSDAAGSPPLDPFMDSGYPIGTAAYQVLFYHNEQVTSPYTLFYILNHNTWELAWYIQSVPTGVALLEDIHAYFSLDEHLLPHPAFYSDSPANRNFYLQRIATTQEA
ncbi:hypothetical protein EDB92DRAFT_1941187 [Lactarius akahatsu]|uniref:Uncharacterized protein n=1 Tax=Lactarius akahatsu TaxID=416441 RepID=A0AAD4LPV4_9AGAM|nr:hypothetical protein EDB92DRAFT_1941187 [Lactarius akahatsu]